MGSNLEMGFSEVKFRLRLYYRKDDIVYLCGYEIGSTCINCLLRGRSKIAERNVIIGVHPPGATHIRAFTAAELSYFGIDTIIAAVVEVRYEVLVSAFVCFVLVVAENVVLSANPPVEGRDKRLK